MASLLELRQVSKRFPGVLALDAIDFDLGYGEVHALLGENGAGKSTMVKIITGAYRRDSGRVTVDGQQVIFNSPSDAQKAGIGVIFQEFSLVDSLSVAENLFLGCYPMKAGFVDWSSMSRLAAEQLKLFNIDIEPSETLSSLGVANKQMVEILKVLRRDGLKILVLDEPTSSLSDAESQALFGFIRELKKQGVSIIYISHRLDEIKQICDQVTVFRNGRVVGSKDAGSISISTMVEMMTGSVLDDQYPKKLNVAYDECIVVDGLSGPGFEDVSFSASKGEVLGITGLVGAGKSEVIETIFGVRQPTQGCITIEGEVYTAESPQKAIDHGIGLLPENRKTQGLVLSMSCANNITLASLDSALLSLAEENSSACKKFVELEIRPNDPLNEVVNLSGGNQQKIVLAKWLERNCRILLFDEPTRGIDVGAKFQIYSIIREQAALGKTVIMASSEIEEIVGICDRVAVMRNGKIVGFHEKSDVTRESILETIAGETH